MLLFPLAALAGAALGRSRGGRLAGLGAVRLRAPALVWVAVAIQALLGVTGPMAWPFGGRFPILVATYLAVGAWLVINAVADAGLRLALGLLALGWLLNLAAIIPNQGMPVSLEALDSSGGRTGVTVDQGHFGKHVEASPRTTLAWLGDVIPAPWLDSVISIGDLVMSVGVAIGVSGSMRRPLARPGGGPPGITPSTRWVRHQ